MGRAALLASLGALFAGVGCLCGYEVLLAHRALKRDPERSFGMLMRKFFYMLLALANASRAVALWVEAGAEPAAICQHEAACALVRSTPNVFFITLYGLLILFWAQLSYTTSGAPFLLLRAVFLSLNVLLYVLFVILAIGAAVSSRHLLWGRLIFLETGIGYAVVFFGVAYYAYELMQKLRPRLAGHNAALVRLQLLSAVSCVVTAIQAAYFLSVGSSIVKWESGYPPFILPSRFDVLDYVLLELVPSLLLIGILWKGLGGGGGSGGGGSSSNSRHHPMRGLSFLRNAPWSRHRYEPIPSSSSVRPERSNKPAAAVGLNPIHTGLSAPGRSGQI